jgi:hypothetical protein
MIGEAFKYFDAIYLINLDSRPDRLVRVMSSFDALGIVDRVQRFPGIIPEGGSGAYGCLMSHVAIIKKAKELRLKNVLVFEDDVQLLNIESISPAISQLSSQPWALYYLGYNSHAPLTQATPNLLKLTKCYAAHAIAYNSIIFDLILSEFEKNKINIIDVWLADNIQSKFKCFGNYPIGAIQIPSYSDIEKRQVNYEFIMNRFIENTKHLGKKR